MSEMNECGLSPLAPSTDEWGAEEADRNDDELAKAPERDGTRQALQTRQKM